jgi:hypothetical protein
VTIVGPTLDWTDNREKDALDEEHRQAHQLCAHDGLDRHRESRLLAQVVISFEKAP